MPRKQWVQKNRFQDNSKQPEEVYIAVFKLLCLGYVHSRISAVVSRWAIMRGHSRGISRQTVSKIFKSTFRLRLEGIMRKGDPIVFGHSIDRDFAYFAMIRTLDREQLALAKRQSMAKFNAFAQVFYCGRSDHPDHDWCMRVIEGKTNIPPVNFIYDPRFKILQEAINAHRQMDWLSWRTHWFNAYAIVLLQDENTDLSEHGARLTIFRKILQETPDRKIPFRETVTIGNRGKEQSELVNKFTAYRDKLSSENRNWPILKEFFDAYIYSDEGFFM